MKSMTLVSAAALAGALYFVSPAAKADEVFFGSQPTPSGCGAVSGTGSVCGPDAAFPTLGDVFVAHGFTGTPGPAAGDANLTFKPIPLNAPEESGLGVQSDNIATTCTNNPDCEILPPQSVSVTSPGGLINDLLIGSVQDGETFNFWIQTSAGGPFTELNTTPIDNTCNFPGGSVAGTDLCSWAGTPKFGVAVEALTGDQLVTAISEVPGPVVGAGLPGLIAALGGLVAMARRRRKQLA